MTKFYYVKRYGYYSITWYRYLETFDDISSLKMVNYSIFVNVSTYITMWYINNVFPLRHKKQCIPINSIVIYSQVPL